MKDFMVDIETIGGTPDGAIVQIGVLQFDPMSEKMGASFSQNIQWESSLGFGMRQDEGATKFWKSQPKETVDKVFKGGVSLDVGLNALKSFLNNHSDQNSRIMWASSPAFDLVIINTALRLCKMPELWRYYNERDARTIYHLYYDLYQNHEWTGVSHDALRDCKHQSLILQKCFKKIYGN